MKAKSARRAERLAQALKDNLKRRKQAGVRASGDVIGAKTADAPAPSQGCPNEATKQD